MPNAGELTIKLQGDTSSFVSSSLTVYQPVDSSMIAGNGVLLDIKGDDLGWYYDSTADSVYIITTDGHSVALVRKGDYWQWVVGANDLGVEATDPGASVTKNAQIVVERTAAGVRSRLVSRTFSLVMKRQYGFSPSLISGLLAWWDAYDITDAVAAFVATWDDRSRLDRDLIEATNKPTRRDTVQGRPYVEFDGTNDLMSTTLADIGTACTVFVVASINTYDATTRGVIQVGGTNGARIAFSSTNLKGISGADIANTSLPALDAWFVAVATKAASGAITIQKGTAAAVSTASVAAVTVGTVGMGDTAADAVADVGVMEAIIYDSVLSADNIEKVVRHLQQKWNATG